MSNGTRTRRQVDPGKPGTGARLDEQRLEGCGAWYFVYLPAGKPPQLKKSYSLKTLPDGTKSKQVRYSFENAIYFCPNPNNECHQYSFVQFVKRTAFDVDGDGNEGNVVQEWSSDWHPDIEGWHARWRFQNPDQIVYPKTRKTNGGKCLTRVDAPGIEFALHGPIPKNRKFKWEFKVYVLCCSVEEMRAAGFIEFSFEIVFDKYGKPKLILDPTHITRTVICCNVDEELREFIDGFHLHDDDGSDRAHGGD